MTRTLLKLLAVVAGVAWFGWYLSRVDLQSVGQAIGQLGWLALLLLLPYGLVYVADCLGWRFSFPRSLAVPFTTLFRIRWAGEAVNNIVPSAYLGGEAVKVYLLQKQGVTAQTGTSSAVVSKTAQTLAQLFYVLLAAFALLHLSGEKPGLRTGMVVVLTGGVMVMTGLFWIQRRGLFVSLLTIQNVLRIQWPWVERHRDRILEVDRTISDYYRHHRQRFYTSTVLYLAGWLLDTLEIYLTAKLLGLPIVWTQALAVEAFTSVAKILGLWVPGALGVQESSIVMLGRMAGLPDTLSVAYALLRRAREASFAIIGLLCLYSAHTNLRMIKDRTAQATGD